MQYLWFFHFVFQLRNLLIEFTIFKKMSLLSPSYVRISKSLKTQKIQKSRKVKSLSIQEAYSSFRSRKFFEIFLVLKKAT